MCVVMFRYVCLWLWLLVGFFDFYRFGKDIVFVVYGFDVCWIVCVVV